MSRKGKLSDSHPDRLRNKFEYVKLYYPSGEKTWVPLPTKGTVIGVSVKDRDYDPLERKISDRVTIVAIIDVGGQVKI